jgi:NAD(P) transhydrogenase subunit beta
VAGEGRTICQSVGGAQRQGGNMSLDLVTLLYLVASVCFIQALKGLSHPTTSLRGNLFGMVGMAIAMVTTAALIVKLAGSAQGLLWVLVGLVVGGGYGAWRAKTVEMTAMPQLVAFFHSMIGLAAVFIAVAVAVEPHAMLQGLHKGEPVPTGNRLELALGAAIGAITFSGSVIAWGKLTGTYKFRLFQGAPVVFKGQHIVNLVLGLATIFFIVGYTLSEARIDFWLLVALSFVLGVLIIIPIGGADMPVVVSMLNSYSGWAAAGIGFSLNNSMLIIAGSLVGSSGAILSYIMCRAMNRSFFSVILGGFGGETSGPAAGAQQRSVKSGSADDAAFILSNAETVIIVPGYGLAVARAQHAVKELASKLTEKGVTVKYAIHPVAGRMPRHMNVLLAEAEVPYDQVFEMEDINGEFGQADVAIILGANDVVNPAALVKGSAIYGMPILEAHKAKTVIVNKRSMATGYAGLDNDLFYMDKTMMVFGDAKKVVEDMVKAVE